jgi:hypothetical protein
MSQSSLDTTGNVVATNAGGAFEKDGQWWVPFVRKGRYWKHQKPADAWVLGQTIALRDTPDELHSWICYECGDRVRLFSGRVSNASDHLKGHGKWPGGSVISSPSMSELGSTAPITVSERSTLARKGQQSLNFSKIEEFKKRMVYWIVSEHLPFTAVESPAFRDMLLALNPLAANKEMTGDSVRRWIQKEYATSIEQVKLKLKQAECKIHISFDAWTSPGSKYALLGVVAHSIFRGPQGLHNQPILIGLRRLKEKHDGVYIGNILASILLEYDIVDNLGIFMADNPSVNDHAIEECLKILKPEEARNWQQRRGRCCAHIINLVAKAFLFGRDVEAFEDKICELGEDFSDFDEDREVDDLEASQDLWREYGPLGKLHNIIRYLRSSPGRREEWRKVKISDNRLDELIPSLDNMTRWNSHYKSIKDALLLRERLERFQHRFRDDLQEFLLSEKDWDHLHAVAEILEQFKEITDELQGNSKKGHHGSMWEWLPTIEVLMKYCETEMALLERQDRLIPNIAIALQNAHQKLQTYYAKSDHAHEIYAAATLMYPETKMKYFDENWTDPKTTAKWKKVMLIKITKLWKTQYEPRSKAEDEDADQPPTKKVSLLDDHLHRVPVIKGDIFTGYIHSHPVQLMGDNIIAWWDTRGPKQLKQMAFDLISMPATSCEVERVFSSAKLLITTQRFALKDTTIEMLELQRYWWRHDIIQQRMSDDRE